jgi:hypothetical protein
MRSRCVSQSAAAPAAAPAAAKRPPNERELPWPDPPPELRATRAVDSDRDDDAVAAASGARRAPARARDVATREAENILESVWDGRKKKKKKKKMKR